MKITAISPKYVAPKDEGVCGEFTLTFDDSLKVHKVMVINGKKGLFVAYPSSGIKNRPDGRKQYVDLVCPTSEEFRLYVQRELISFYEKLAADVNQ